MVAPGRISNSFKLLYMSSLPANMKRIQSKIAEKCDDIVFPNISLWDFFKHSRAANTAVLGLIWPNLKLVRDVMNVLITCKYEEDSIKTQRTNGPVNAHLIYWPSKAQNIQNLENIW